MDFSTSVLIWQGRRGPHLLRCLAEQVGEGCFELRLYWGKEILADESFEEPRPMLIRADELRAEFRGERE